MTGPRYTCKHGLRRELASYRGVRIWQMNCGEVNCSLAPRDFFQVGYIHEWIDGAIAGEDLHKWVSLDRAILESVQRQQAAAGRPPGRLKRIR